MRAKVFTALLGRSEADLSVPLFVGPPTGPAGARPIGIDALGDPGRSGGWPRLPMGHGSRHYASVLKLLQVGEGCGCLLQYLHLVGVGWLVQDEFVEPEAVSTESNPLEGLDRAPRGERSEGEEGATK
jgi:hypothetical protein